MITTSRKTRARLAAVAVAAVGVLAAGCSGGPDQVDGGGPLPSTTAAPAKTAAPAAPASEAATTAAPVSDGDAPNCATRDLAITLTDRDAGAGSAYATISFRNLGPGTCRLRGFPGVSYVTGDDGQQVGAAAEMSGPRGDQIRLAPGDTAGAALQMPQAGNFDAAVCRPTPVRGLRVYPPGETASGFVPLETTGCAGTTPSAQLLVQTVKAS
jgi:hypothetical protein